jgi:hypothetical protein
VIGLLTSPFSVKTSTRPVGNHAMILSVGKGRGGTNGLLRSWGLVQPWGRRSPGDAGLFV